MHTSSVTVVGTLKGMASSFREVLSGCRDIFIVCLIFVLCESVGIGLIRFLQHFVFVGGTPLDMAVNIALGGGLSFFLFMFAIFYIGNLESARIDAKYVAMGDDDFLR